jgi:hypothetical protein
MSYGSGMGVGGVVRTAVTAVARAVEVALALPRIALALERIADATDDVRRLADLSPAIETMGALAGEARRLLGDPARYAELVAAIEAIIKLGEAAASVGPLGDAVRQLNSAAIALTTTVTPLQGASERFGRLVDLLPSSRPRPTVDPEPESS